MEGRTSSLLWVAACTLLVSQAVGLSVWGADSDRPVDFLETGVEEQKGTVHTYHQFKSECAWVPDGTPLEVVFVGGESAVSRLKSGSAQFFKSLKGAKEVEKSTLRKSGEHSIAKPAVLIDPALRLVSLDDVESGLYENGTIARYLNTTHTIGQDGKSTISRADIRLAYHTIRLSIKTGERYALTDEERQLDGKVTKEITRALESGDSSASASGPPDQPSFPARDPKDKCLLPFVLDTGVVKYDCVPSEEISCFVDSKGVALSECQPGARVRVVGRDVTEEEYQKSRSKSFCVTASSGGELVECSPERPGENCMPDAVSYASAYRRQSRSLSCRDARYCRSW